MTRYRWTTVPLGMKRGEWQDTRRAAMEDAVAAGMADYDEHEPERIYLDALVEIEAEVDHGLEDAEEA